MEPTKYKDVQVQRGYTYHYYFAPASEGKPTLLFIHGFPSSSFDWSRQVSHFQPKGYGLLVPDCLGYGGTSKPTEYQEYRWKLQAQDLVDVLDAEGIKTVIGVGHDWGSVALSALAQYHQDRFDAFAWLAVAYVPPRPDAVDYEDAMKSMKELTGSDVYGYWAFFNQPDSHVKCEKNIDSFLQLLYPENPEIWLEWLSPIGKSQEWVESNRQPGRPLWLSDHEYATLRETLVKSGLQSGMNYYKITIAQGNAADYQALPEAAWHVKKPSLWIAAARDFVCRVAFGKVTMDQYAPHAETVELDTGHWPQLEASAETNATLEKWLEKLRGNA